MYWPWAIPLLPWPTECNAIRNWIDVMKVMLRYGTSQIDLRSPKENVQDVLRPWRDPRAPDSAAILQEAVAHGAGPFQADAAGRRVCVLLADGTRPQPSDAVTEAIFAMLKQGAAAQFLVATGTHRPDTPQTHEIVTRIDRAARQAGIANPQVHAHDCRSDKLWCAGRTSRGTRISANALANDADVFLVISDVKVHYFAGYSNPLKYFVPGICAFETAEQNHSLTLDDRSMFGRHPWHPDPTHRDNPLAADQLDGMRLIAGHRPVYALTMVGAGEHLYWANFGPAKAASAAAFRVADERNIHTVTPADRLIVSPGGAPNDVDLYIAQRALELTKAAVMDGGEVLFLSACPGGIGEPHTMENFYNRLTAPIETILSSIEDRYVLYSHKPYRFAQMIRRLGRIWVHSQIPAASLQAAHLHPTDDPQAVVDTWLAERPDARILIVDGANTIALRSIS